MELLVPESLVLADSTNDLARALEAPDKIEAICPCHAVRDYLLDQHTCYEVLEGYVKRGALKQVPIAYVLHLAGGADQARLADPSRETDAVVFVRDRLYNDWEELVQHRAIREYLEVAQIPLAFFSDYKVGPKLAVQTGAGRFTGYLTRAFSFLNLFGLIDQKMLGTPFAHSSVIMLIKRALGMKQYGWLIPYIANPARFMAQTLALSLDPQQEEGEGDLVARLEGVLWESAGRRPYDRDARRDSCSQEEDAGPRFYFEASTAMRLLDYLRARHKRLEVAVSEFVGKSQTADLLTLVESDEPDSIDEYFGAATRRAGLTSAEAEALHRTTTTTSG